MTKQKVAKYAGCVSEESFNGNNLLSIYDEVVSLMKQYGEDSTLDFSYDCDGCLDMSITSYREETDEEYDKRIHQEAATHERGKQEELKTLERLRQKYGV